MGRFSLIVKIIISPGCENLQHTKLFNEDDFLNSTEIHNYIAGPLLEFVLVYKIKLQLAAEPVVNSNVIALFIRLSFPRIVDLPTFALVQEHFSRQFRLSQSPSNEAFDSLRTQPFLLAPGR